MGTKLVVVFYEYVKTSDDSLHSVATTKRKVRNGYSRQSKYEILKLTKHKIELFCPQEEDVAVVLLCLAKYNSMSYVAFTPL